MQCSGGGLAASSTVLLQVQRHYSIGRERTAIREVRASVGYSCGRLGAEATREVDWWDRTRAVHITKLGPSVNHITI